jgi:hypothetical protein
VTPAQIRAELDPTAPLYAELVALWHPDPATLPPAVPPFLPTTVNNDPLVADVLNRRDRPGCVPARHVVVALARFPQLDAAVHWSLRTGTLPDGTSLAGPRFPLYVLFRNLDRVERSAAFDEPLRADVAALTAGLTALTAAAPALVPDGFAAFLLGGEVKLSRAEEATGVFGDTATAGAVETARLTLDPVPPPG